MNVRKEVLDLLLSFLKTATGNRATNEEMKLIPEVAKLLLDYSESSEESSLSVK